MTIEQAEAILLRIGGTVALRHRFAGDRGTILRLDNNAMINIFDDGRYYIQGENATELLSAFTEIEQPWDPDTWTAVPEPILPWFPPVGLSRRFDM
jgi:hypothetical protein